MGKTYKDERKRGYETKEEVWRKRAKDRSEREGAEVEEGDREQRTLPPEMVGKKRR